MVETGHLKGSFTPVVTPFKTDGSIDFERYEKLVDFQITNGSHGVVVNGTTAEPSVLSVGERNELVRRAVDVAQGRIPVVAATGSQSLEDTLELTRFADNADVAGMMVVTPYYIKPPQRGLIAFYEAVGEVTQRPLLIYHIPGRAGVSMDVETVVAVKEKVPHLSGIKHASLDLGYVTELLKTLGKDFRIFVGLEELSFPMLAIGAAGLMNAVGNMRPDLVAAMCNAAFEGDWEAAQKLHFDLFELNKAVFWDTNPIPMKYVMNRLGLIDGNHHRVPMMPATDEVAGRLDKLIETCGLFEPSRFPALAAEASS